MPDALDHIAALINAPRPPALPPELEADPRLAEIDATLRGLRTQLANYARGDFSQPLPLRGAMCGSVKTLAANIQHLIWQIRQIEGGDYTQRVDFMGDFSDAFNKMVVQMDSAISALRLREENFKYLAEHDQLTGLPNRRAFFARAELMLSHDRIMGLHGCVAFMDVDHFKKFNDTWGHANGDQALMHVARVANESLRTHDIMGRYGGEEFVFYFSGTNATQGVKALERIRALIERSPVELDDGRSVELTASFGLVSVPPDLTVPADAALLSHALEQADKGLYDSKAQGRNRVTMRDYAPPDAGQQ